MGWRTKNILLIFLGGITSLLAVYFAALYIAHDRNPDFLGVDSCLDGGGCWDYVDRVCREDEPNAQALCDRKINSIDRK